MEQVEVEMECIQHHQLQQWEWELKVAMLNLDDNKYATRTTTISRERQG